MAGTGLHTAADTIAAVSSPAVGGDNVGRSIVRVSGDDALQRAVDVFSCRREIIEAGIYRGRIRVDDDYGVEGCLYVFRGPHSYTGEDIAELHFTAAEPVVEAVLSRVLENCRQAGPGEFTLRAYLNGRMDLSQAEAVAELVSGASGMQVAAAQKLLAGSLSRTIGAIRQAMFEVMSLLEAGLDFSTEEIELISPEQARERIGAIAERLEAMLDGAIRYEEMIDLPCVGIAGATNAGKSTLLNALLGSERSIVSERPATTRDIVSGTAAFEKTRCVLFDCAGLGADIEGGDVLDAMGQAAAVYALEQAQAVIFCVDLSKEDFNDDVRIRNRFEAERVIYLGTQCDRIDEDAMQHKLEELGLIFGDSFLAVSASTGYNLDVLRERIEREILAGRAGGGETDSLAAINQRHRRVVQEAVEQVRQAEQETEDGQDEIAAMLLRQAYRSLGGIESEDVDEKILGEIFSRFCIGK